MERVEALEMLDSDHWSEEEVSCALGAIRRVNRMYGGNRTHKRLFDRVAVCSQLKELEVLEVASGRGEVLQAAARKLMKRDISVRISLLDRNDLHLPKPRDWHPDLPQPTLLVGDALAIPMEDRSVDVVSSCLFLHHLSMKDARAFLTEALRVSRVAVLINDLERTRTNYLLSRLQTLIDPSKLSRHDGPTSVRQAYTFREVETMLRETGCGFELQRGFLFRLGAILWRK